MAVYSKLRRFRYDEAWKNRSSRCDWILGDHLGSSSVTADANGNNPITQLYTAWGTVRWSSGSLQTKYTYTGQYSHTTEFGLLFYNARWYDPALGRWGQADTLIPGDQGVQAFDRYAYVNNSPVKYSDPTGYFSEEQIKTFLGFKNDAAWEDVLTLFEEGGIYAGRWGWLEMLRRAEIGDQITIDWAEGVLPEGHPAYDGPFTFGLDPNGDLILYGDGFYLGHEIAGLHGENYYLSHYTDLSAFACSPYECDCATNFSTSAVHDPYLHTQVKWDELATNWPETIHVAEMAGATMFVGGLTVAGAGIMLETCVTPISCFAGVALMGPPTAMGAIATYYLFQGTILVIRHEFIETTP